MSALSGPRDSAFTPALFGSSGSLADGTKPRAQCSFKRTALEATTMPRFVVVFSAAVLTSALSTHAVGQVQAHTFSGLCAYYSAVGDGLTAAHRTLPFGTRVRVTDPKTGRSVIVTINDRGPFGRNRVLDISTSAARALKMMDRGVIFVQADVL